MGAATEKQDREPKDDKTTVSVVYNGITETIEFQPQQAVQALLAHALNAFGIVANREAMALFTADGTPLEPHAGIGESGIKPGDQLVLRQRVVRGGLA